MSASSKARRTAAAVGVAVVGLVATAACGSASNATSSTSQQPAAAAARAAFAGLAGRNAETVTIRLEGGAADLVALSKGQGAPLTTPLTTEQADALAGGQVVIAAKAAGSSFSADLQRGSTAGESYAVEVDSATAKNLLQLVVADRKLYVRLDARAAAPLLGGNLGPLLAIAGHLPAQAGFLGDLLAGKWIELDTSKLPASAAGTPTGSPSPGPGQFAALRAALATVLSKDVTTTRAAADPRLGDHLVLTADARTIGADLLGALKTALASLPGASTALGALPSSLPDKTLTVDEYVKDGTLSALRLRLDPLLAGASGPVTLAVDVASGATVTPPSSATPVDPAALSGLSSLF